jgi:hypothetical protein
MGMALSKDFFIAPRKHIAAIEESLCRSQIEIQGFHICKFKKIAFTYSITAN